MCTLFSSCICILIVVIARKCSIHYTYVCLVKLNMNTSIRSIIVKTKKKRVKEISNQQTNKKEISNQQTNKQKQQQELNSIDRQKDVEEKRLLLVYKTNMKQNENNNNNNESINEIISNIDKIQYNTTKRVCVCVIVQNNYIGKKRLPDELCID